MPMCAFIAICNTAYSFFTATSYWFRPLTNTPNGSVVLLPLIATFNKQE